MEGVYRSTATANCAPTISAELLRATVVMMTAKRAIKLYPPLRWTVLEVGEVLGEVIEVCDRGMGRAFASARKASRMKEEKEVREPQKPVESPI